MQQQEVINTEVPVKVGRKLIFKGKIQSSMNPTIKLLQQSQKAISSESLLQSNLQTTQQCEFPQNSNLKISKLDFKFQSNPFISKTTGNNHFKVLRLSSSIVKLNGQEFSDDCTTPAKSVTKQFSLKVRSCTKNLPQQEESTRDMTVNSQGRIMTKSLLVKAKQLDEQIQRQTIFDEEDQDEEDNFKQLCISLDKQS